FPALKADGFALSQEAVRYQKSGKSFLYRSLPFGLASLVNRVLVVVVPLLVLLVPGLKLIPAVYRWRVNLGMYRWYRALLQLEQDMIARLNSGNREELLEKLAQIESAVNRMKVPAPFAGQFYELRGHINFVRQQLGK